MTFLTLAKTAPFLQTFPFLTDTTRLDTALQIGRITWPIKVIYEQRGTHFPPPRGLKKDCITEILK